jgi:putative ABC transport system ATP-binding protein
MTLALGARDITVVHGGRRIVDAASLSLEPASMHTIEGGSGSGKSTLLRAIATLIPVESGVITFEGRDVRELPVTEYRRRVAYVPQLPAMFEGSVADNVRTGPRFRGAMLAESEVTAQLGRVGLAPDFAPRAAANLSGGERLRLALARALANEPRVLLLDEPTSALDPASSRVILDLLRALAEGGTAILVVTHSHAHAEHLDGARHRMEAGVLQREGP